MAGERTLPGLALTGFWDEGSNGWKDAMDANLRALSALVQLGVISRTTALPGSPSDGNIYIIPTGETDAGKVAVRDNGAWVNLTPAEGWTAWVADDDEAVVYDGSAWGASGGGLTDAPSDGTVYGRQDGSWVEAGAAGIVPGLVRASLPILNPGFENAADLEHWTVTGSATAGASDGTGFSTVTPQEGSKYLKHNLTDGADYSASQVVAASAPDGGYLYVSLLTVQTNSFDDLPVVQVEFLDSGDSVIGSMLEAICGTTTLAQWTRHIRAFKAPSLTAKVRITLLGRYVVGTITNVGFDDVSAELLTFSDALGIQINAQTGTTYTFVLADSKTLVTADNAAAQTYTIPDNATTEFPVGTMISLKGIGAGTASFAVDGTDTLNGVAGGGGDISAAWNTVTFTKIDTTAWSVDGPHDGIA